MARDVDTYQEGEPQSKKVMKEEWGEFEKKRVRFCSVACWVLLEEGLIERMASYCRHLKPPNKVSVPIFGHSNCRPFCWWYYPGMCRQPVLYLSYKLVKSYMICFVEILWIDEVGSCIIRILLVWFAFIIAGDEDMGVLRVDFGKQGLFVAWLRFEVRNCWGWWNPWN